MVDWSRRCWHRQSSPLFAFCFWPHVSWHTRATWSYVLQSDGVVWVAGAWNCGSCLIPERTNVRAAEIFVLVCSYIIKGCSKKEIRAPGRRSRSDYTNRSRRVVSAPRLESWESTPPSKGQTKGDLIIFIRNPIRKTLLYVCDLGLLTNLHVINMLQCSQQPFQPPKCKIIWQSEITSFYAKERAPRSFGHRSCVKFGPPPAPCRISARVFALIRKRQWRQIRPLLNYALLRSSLL
jgi:hypothetical protein